MKKEMTFEEKVQLVVDAKLNKRADENLLQFAARKGIELDPDPKKWWKDYDEFERMKKEVSKRIEQYKVEHNMENIVKFTE